MCKLALIAIASINGTISQDTGRYRAISFAGDDIQCHCVTARPTLQAAMDICRSFRLLYSGFTLLTIAKVTVDAFF